MISLNPSQYPVSTGFLLIVDTTDDNIHSSFWCHHQQQINIRPNYHRRHLLLVVCHHHHHHQQHYYHHHKKSCVSVSMLWTKVLCIIVVVYHHHYHHHLHPVISLFLYHYSVEWLMVMMQCTLYAITSWHATPSQYAPVSIHLLSSSFSSCHRQHEINSHPNYHHRHLLLVAGVLFFFVLVPFLFYPLCFFVVFLAAWQSLSLWRRHKNP